MLQLGWLHTHEDPLHVVPDGHVPQLPPQPSEPHCLPAQLGTHTLTEALQVLSPPGPVAFNVQVVLSVNGSVRLPVHSITSVAPLQV